MLSALLIGRAFIILLTSFTVSTHAHAQPKIITGYVFADLNKNGYKDDNEPGIHGAAVSNQETVTTSNKEGFYQLNNIGGYGIIFISTPNGFNSEKPFWKNTADLKNSEQVNFPLIKIPFPSSFKFIHASDTHLSDDKITRMDKFRAIIDSVKPDLVIITGDLVKDALRVSEKEATHVYELFIKERNKIKSPVWLIPGNHEIFGIERQSSLVSPQHPLYGRKMYRHYLGPDYYSFNYGGIHFIGLNSVEFEDMWYYGRIDSAQIEWIKKDIATVSKTTPVITFQHIPFYNAGISIKNFQEYGSGRSLEREHGVLQFRHVVSNAADVMKILKGNNYPLALSGHNHIQQNISFEGMQTRFEQTAALVPVQSEVFNFNAGITLYTVKDFKIDEGQFIPIDK